MSVVRCVLAFIVLAVGVSCDRPPPTKLAPAMRTVLDIRPLAQLPPNRNVQVAIDRLGNVFYTVETPDGQDAVSVVADDGLPRVTRFTSANILTALGESAGGSGTIQQLAQGPEGTLYFYFVGGRAKNLRACVGIYVPRTDSIAILFDTRTLGALSGMGQSLELARSSLVVSGPNVWLLLRHTDAWALFRFDARLPIPGYMPQLENPFTKVWAEDDELNLAQQRYTISSAGNGNLLLFDTRSGILSDLNEKGQTAMRALLTGLPREMSRPLVMKDGRIRIFAADSETLDADVSEALTRRLPTVSYPALLDLSGKEITAIASRDQLRVTGVVAYAIRTRDLIADPDGSYLAYDPASGQLIRMRVMQEPI